MLCFRVSAEAKRWWQYAITCTLDVIHSRRKSNTLDSVLSAARNNVSYVRAFMAQLENPTMMTEEDKVIKETQDSLRSYEELKELREISVYWVQKNIKNSDLNSVSSSPSRKSSQASGSPQKASPLLSPASDDPPGDEVTSPTLQRWFPLWGGWYNTEARASEASETEVRPELEEFLQDAMKEEHEVFGVSHKDVLFSHVSIDLRQAVIQLTRSKTGQETSPLFEFEFQNVRVRSVFVLLICLIFSFLRWSMSIGPVPSPTFSPSMWALCGCETRLPRTPCSRCWSHPRARRARPCTPRPVRAGSVNLPGPSRHFSQPAYRSRKRRKMSLPSSTFCMKRNHLIRKWIIGFMSKVSHSMWFTTLSLSKWSLSFSPCLKT